MTSFQRNINFLPHLRRSQIITTYRSIASFNQPRPPLLPATQQKEFEELIKKANAPALSKGGEDVVHPDARPKLKPDFEGDRNPVTGEIGGPKTDPLKHNDWSYGGRATDF